VEELTVPEDAKLVNLFHYAKDPQRSHGVPCRFVIYRDEPFSETKQRLQKRIGASEKDFSRFKFSLISAGTFKQPSVVTDREYFLESL
jgi:ubiquitin carboxyl-terminal hydrolase 7